MSERPSGSRDRDPDEEADVVLVDSNQTGQDRERALIAKLPDKEGSQLKKEEIQLIIRIENEPGRNFLFAVGQWGNSRALWTFFEKAAVLSQQTQRAPEQPLRHVVDDSDSDDDVIIRRADVPRNIDEVTNYIEDHFNETASPVFDPLSFWHTYEERYPKLSKLALRIFAVPASSASCERAFRRLKATITDNRQNLDPETVTKLMLSRGFINSTDDSE